MPGTRHGRIDRAMAQDPKDRYPDAKSVAAAMNAIVSQSGTQVIASKTA